MLKKAILMVFIISLISNVWASDIIFSVQSVEDNPIQIQQELEEPTKLGCLCEVLSEYLRIGYYNKRSFETITLNGIQMNSRMDCSGFMSAYVVNYANKILGKQIQTGLDKNTQLDLSSVNFEIDWDSSHTKYMNKIPFRVMENLEPGDICWSGNHFIVYAGKSNNEKYPFLFYHWSGETKEDDKNYKDYKAKDYCELLCKCEYIKEKGKIKGVKLKPKSYAGISNSKEYRHFYRLKEW